MVIIKKAHAGTAEKGNRRGLENRGSNHQRVLKVAVNEIEDPSLKASLSLKDSRTNSGKRLCHKRLTPRRHAAREATGGAKKGEVNPCTVGPEPIGNRTTDKRAGPTRTLRGHGNRARSLTRMGPCPKGLSQDPQQGHKQQKLPLGFCDH